MRRFVMLCAAVLSAACQGAPREASSDAGPAESVAPSEPSADAGAEETADAGSTRPFLPAVVQPVTYSKAVGGGENCLAGDTDGTGTVLTGVFDDNLWPDPNASFSFILADGGSTGCRAVYVARLSNGFFCYSHSDEGQGSSYQAWTGGAFSPSFGIPGQISDATADSTCLRVREDIEVDGGWLNRLRCVREDPSLATLWSAPAPESAPQIALDADGCSLLYGLEFTGTVPRNVMLGSWVDARGTTTALFQSASVPGGYNSGQITAAVGMVGGAAVRTAGADGGAGWTAWLPHGSNAIQRAPAWLAARPNTDIAVIEGGKAYAILPWPIPGAAPQTRTISILDTSGAALGELTLDVPAESANGHFRVGYDGSLILSWSAQSSGYEMHQCGWTVWPQMLR